jgi:hypothetical protein
MNKQTFYSNKTITKIEVWISDCTPYPNLQWARLRIFSDGSADATFFGESKNYGFDCRDSASAFLCEDEYTRFDLLDEEEAKLLGVSKAQLSPPTWPEPENEFFEYLGTY